VEGRGLAQLSNKKSSIVNGSLQPICCPLALSALYWGRVWGWELAQLNNKKFSMMNISLRPIWPPPEAGWGAGTCPTEQPEIINDKQFTLINLAAPCGRVGGRELAQLNKNFSIINSSLQPICPPPPPPARGGFWGREVSSWKNVKMAIQIFHFDRFGGKIGRSENFFHFLANRSKRKYVSFLAAPWGRVWGGDLYK
jgi:hypothetical protein